MALRLEEGPGVGPGVPGVPVPVGQPDSEHLQGEAARLRPAALRGPRPLYPPP